MARVKLTVRNHVRVPPHRNVVPTESHSDGQNAGVPRLLRGNSYLWCVRVIIYERPTINRIHRIRHVVEATTPRWTFEEGMREAAREALALI
jgi:hypothetical protein